jgi:hypothetical protein
MLMMMCHQKVSVQVEISDEGDYETPDDIGAQDT